MIQDTCEVNADCLTVANVNMLEVCRLVVGFNQLEPDWFFSANAFSFFKLESLYLSFNGRYDCTVSTNLLNVLCIMVLKSGLLKKMFKTGFLSL